MSGPRWAVATDAAELHQLVIESDQIAARESGTTAPLRRLASTERCVASGSSWVWIDVDGHYLATLTVESAPSFDLSQADFPAADCPWYMRRLAVGETGRRLGVWLSLQAVHLAGQLCASQGADWLRCEINPGLTKVADLLLAVGFVVVPSRRADRADLGWMAWHLGSR